MKALDHLAAIKAGEVTKTTVIGLRKAINADERRGHGWSTSPTCPKLTSREIAEIERALGEFQPRVVGPLHDSGLALLRSPRYKKRLENVRAIIDGLESFHLIGYDRIGSHGDHCVPVYKAKGAGGSFVFRNIPWQSGGNGPEVLKVNYNG